MKTIRALYLPFLILATIPLLASMCSKKNNDPVPKNAHPATVTSVWAWQHLYIDPPADNIDDILKFYVDLSILTNKCVPIFLYEFKADGTVVPYEQKYCATTGISALTLGPQTGDKWSVSGNKITMTHADGSKDVADLELTDGTSTTGTKIKVMIWKRQVGAQKYTWRFEREL